MHMYTYIVGLTCRYRSHKCWAYGSFYTNVRKAKSYTSHRLMDFVYPEKRSVSRDGVS